MREATASLSYWIVNLSDVMARWPYLLRNARRRSGWGQRRLAVAAGTSPATVSNYETGAKEPRAGTLERLLAAAGLELETVPLRSTKTRRVDLICAALAERVMADPTLLAAAREHLAAVRGVHGEESADRWINSWQHLLQAGPEAVAAVLTSSSPAARPLKSATPLAGMGLLDEDVRSELLIASREGPPDVVSQAPEA